MQRFKFRLNKKKDGDRLIMVWLESLPEGKRSLWVKEVLREYIENNSKGLCVNGRERLAGSENTDLPVRERTPACPVGTADRQTGSHTDVGKGPDKPAPSPRSGSALSQGPEWSQGAVERLLDQMF